ncbi:MAG: protein kinase [Clostridia bacterium]|nr:protein kinase [Clostridia bacterium]
MNSNPSTVFGTWEINKPLGIGTYGKTYEITNFTKEEGIYKIMKIPVELKKTPGEFPVKTQQDCLKEVRNDILSSIKYIQVSDKGRFFVKYEDYSLTPSEDFRTLTMKIRMEKLVNLTTVSQQHKFSEAEVLRLAVNICRCLEKCREMDYVYTNLKPNNIFITDRGCKLGDFGTFGMYEPTKMNVAMRKTQEYMAPEFIKFGEINSTSDTYALGLIMYSLLNNNKLPFIPRFEENIGISDTNLAIEKRCANYVFSDPDNASEKVKNIIFKACSPSVGNRYETPTDMKNDLLVALGEQTEENPFAVNSPVYADEKEKSSGVSLDNLKMYEYTNKKKQKGSLDKKKKILLLAIAFVFLLLIVVAAVIIFKDNNTQQNTVAVWSSVLERLTVLYER